MPTFKWKGRPSPHTCVIHIHLSAKNKDRKIRKRINYLREYHCIYKDILPWYWEVDSWGREPLYRREAYGYHCKAGYFRYNSDNYLWFLEVNYCNCPFLFVRVPILQKYVHLMICHLKINEDFCKCMSINMVYVVKCIIILRNLDTSVFILFS